MKLSSRLQTSIAKHLSEAVRLNDQVADRVARVDELDRSRRRVARIGGRRHQDIIDPRPERPGVIVRGVHRAGRVDVDPAVMARDQ